MRSRAKDCTDASREWSDNTLDHTRLESLARSLQSGDAVSCSGHTLVTLLKLGVGGCLRSIVTTDEGDLARILRVRDAVASGVHEIDAADCNLVELSGNPSTADVVAALLAPTLVQGVGHVPFSALEVGSVAELNYTGQSMSPCADQSWMERRRKQLPER